MTAFFAFVLVTLPWLNPFSPGPAPAVGPFLFSWVCASLLWLALLSAHPHRQTYRLAQAVVLGWLAAACISASIGLLQYFGATDWAGEWLNHTGIGEAYGNLRQRNQFATLMNIGLAALLWWAANPQTTKPQASSPVALHSLPTLLLVIAALLIGLGNAVSSSRTGLIQLILIAALTWAWQRQTTGAQNHNKPLRPVYRVLLLTLLVYAVALWALPLLAGLNPFSNGAWARLRSGDALCTSRLTLWNNVIHLITQKPLLGWGWGELDYAHFITLYPGARFCDILDNAHNLPLHLAVELGLPFAILMCSLAAWLLWRTQAWRELDATRQLAWAVLAVIGLHSLLEYPLWYGPFQTAALLSIWLLWLTRQRQSGLSVHKKSKLVAVYLPALSATSSIAFCCFAAWNYQLVSQIYLPPSARMADYRDDTLRKISNVALFQDQVRFAALTTTDLDAKNALELHDLALDMLHFSPEVRVVELALESSKLLGRQKEANFLTERYQAAFPEAYAKWAAKQTRQ